jgi:hypothetical protein
MEEEHKRKEQSSKDSTSQVQRVKDEIRAYVDAIEQQDSVQWKAYCDYVDFLQAERDFHAQPFTPDSAGLTYPELRLGLISEVIRQRTNEVPGYKQEYEHITQLVEKLNAAQAKENPEGERLSNPSDLLFSTVDIVTATKERTLQVFTQQTRDHPPSE